MKGSPAALPATLPPAPTGRRVRGLALGGLFLVSGAVGLSYEVAWARGLQRLLGSTVAGHALVLGAFVALLGVGARWGGALALRARRPLRLYGLLELGAAAAALLVLPAAELLAGPYVALAREAGEALRWPLRALLAFLLVGPGAFLLGATLPLVVEAAERAGSRSPSTVAAYYGINTLGAVAGALLTGFFTVGAFGVVPALLGAAVTGAGVGLLALALDRARAAPPGGLGGPAPAPSARAPGSAPGAPLEPAGLWAAGLCGFLGLALEVVGFRALTFFVEGFTTSFAAMLGVFVLGLGAGSLLLGPAVARARRPARALWLLVGLVGFALLASLLLVLPRLEGWLRELRAAAYADARTPADLGSGHRLAALAGAGALLLLPALLLGPTFAACVRLAGARGAPTARALGGVTLANALGSALGPAYAAFLLLPVTGGVLPALFALALLAFAAGALLRFGSARVLAVAPVLLLLVPLLAALGLLRGSDAALVGASHVLAGRTGRTLLEVRTDSVTVASAVRTAQGETLLYTDDFAAASTGPAYRYMALLGHLPALLADRPRHALVIAFGTGTTAGAVAAHPEVGRLTVAEVSRAVLSLAPRFAAVNRGVLDDPRTRLEVDDGRDVLRLSAPDLDLITLEPLMPYAPAGLPFYTREFYELARDRLREGGVVCQWVPVHAMPVGLFDALLRTFFEVFPDGTLWFFEQSVALVGRRGSAAPDAAARARRFEAARGALAAAGYPEADLLATAFVASGRTLLATPAPDPSGPWRRVTDLDPWPEFHATPRGVSTSYLADTLVYLRRVAGAAQAAGNPLAADARAAGRAHQAALAALEARAFDALAERLEARGPAGATERLARLEEAVRAYAQALERVPGEPVWNVRRARAQRGAAALRVGDLHARARLARAGGRAEEALDLERAALGWSWPALALEDGDALLSDRGAAARLHAVALLRLGRGAGAEHALRAVLPALGDAEAARELRLWLEALAGHRRGEAGPRPFGADLPPCRSEGLAPLEKPLAAWRDALARRAPVRALRLAARNLVEAAVAEGAEAALLAELRGAGVEGPAAAVQAALMRLRLDPGDGALDALLAGEPGGAAAALEEAGAQRVLRRVGAARLEALGASPHAAVRAALAAAAGADAGAGLLRLAVAALSDPELEVRKAAAVALVPHDPRSMDDYDPAGPPASWAAVQERLRR